MARRNKRRTLSGRKKNGFLGTFFLILIALALIATTVAGYILFETEKPSLQLEKEITFLGSTAKLPFKASDQRSGLQSITVKLEQDGNRSELFNRSFQRKAWFKPAGPQNVEETVLIETQRAQLKDGQAELIITVRDFSLYHLFKGNETIQRIAVTIDSAPPRVSVLHTQNYLRQGGSGIVTYSLSEKAVQHGVQLDDLFFPGFPITKDSSQYISYIALPWDSAAPKSTKVIAMDAAGNEGKATLSIKFKAVARKKDEINISDNFLDTKLPEFQERYEEMQGTMVEQYLFVNREVRTRNGNTIREICSNPEPERMWQDRFLRMPGANRAGYADQRTYFYKGRAIDKQTHLGIDIASTAKAQVRAANSGRVIYTDYLGIYGHMVIIDHGQGVYSLYSHLSNISAKTGDMVEKDTPLGRTGTSGMAGGDHLHFGMLIHGICVTPKEWWDQHWIDVHIKHFLNTVN